MDIKTVLVYGFFLRDVDLEEKLSSYWELQKKLNEFGLTLALCSDDRELHDAAIGIKIDEGEGHAPLVSSAEALKKSIIKYDKLVNSANVATCIADFLEEDVNTILAYMKITSIIATVETNS